MKTDRQRNVDYTVYFLFKVKHKLIYVKPSENLYWNQKEIVRTEGHT